MAMTVVWAAMVGASLVFGIYSGHLAEVSRGAGEGAQAAVELCLSMAGMLCLWTGVMEAMKRCGLLEVLRSLMSPVLRRLFPEAARDKETVDLIAANLSANLLGLGNAATPLGIQAAERMAAGQKGRRETASADLCRFVVCNTASIQLIPTTVAAIRSGAGSASPFDILPAVWVTSAAALTAGLLACRMLEKAAGGEGTL